MLRNDQIIKEAFTCGGITYYAYDDIFNVPYERALVALNFYEEVRMRTNKEFLLLHVKAVEDILNDPKKIKMGEIALLNRQLKERLEWIIEADLVYKLASVIFFDKNESSTTYDYKYCNEKIKHWKKHSEMNAFFLQMPVQKLIPFLQDCDIDFQRYSQVVAKMSSAHLENITTNLSEETMKQDSVKELISRLVTQQN